MEQASGRETKASLAADSPHGASAGPGDAGKRQQAQNTLRVWQFQTAEESAPIAELDDSVIA